jgi:methionine-S-sulfoxide reductase
MEPPFEKLPGVVSVTSGYTGGKETAPSYKEVRSSGRTGHVEAVQVKYDPTVISYEYLLKVFWRQIDPTDDGGQFADRGKQYRAAIFAWLRNAISRRVAFSRRPLSPLYDGPSRSTRPRATTRTITRRTQRTTNVTVPGPAVRAS